ncbi:hypothetical protein PHLCEN_2v4167 [Hermanssonia centrifuga]|uniref:Uncharacterized protein n=1 Tax=Hermanssonia centrifuga TaxID=98765 RepID=A0A2R6PZ06_9APHY|nr:hypothetical protein PHLCEN_2v4167 [Hermanssonia centrifuga]
MATLIRPRVSSHEPHDTYHDFALNVPKPFPSRAEREQEDLLESLESEELQLDDAVSSTHPRAHIEQTGALVSGPNPDASSEVVLNHRSEDLLPSIGQVQTSCLTTLNDLLSVSSKWTPIVPDRRHSLPPKSLASSSAGLSPSATTQPSSALQTLVSNLRLREQDSHNERIQEANTLSEADLLCEVRARVERIMTTLPPHDAELARTLVALLTHFSRLSVLSPSSTQPRVASWSAINNQQASSHGDPYASLTRQVSDFQLERSWSHGSPVPSGSRTPVVTVETALLWSHIDEELENVLSLCRPRSGPLESRPPEYDPADYEREFDLDSLPEYEPSSEVTDGSGKPLYKVNNALERSNTRLSESAYTNEKMRMDLEAVTLAIDRLYLVAPQLHNQRVELKKSKVEQMEKAKLKGNQKGKQKGKEGEMDAMELDRMLDLIGKAADRKMVNQAVFVDSAFSEKLARAQVEDLKKRAAFVEQLAKHSDAGRLHSQDAVFLAPVRTRSQPQLASELQDPHALLTLPEFIREGIPEPVEERMEAELDPEALLTLPEFIKQYPQPEPVRPAHTPRGQSISHWYLGSRQQHDESPPATVRPTKSNRSRSMSEPLSWLLSGSSSRSSSPSSASGPVLKKPRSGRLSRPKSSNDNRNIPTVHEGLDVSYVAEFHENLYHVLVFVSVTGLQPGHDLEAEVLSPDDSSNGRERLLLKCGGSTSIPLSLPTKVHTGKVDVSVIGGRHYQIKLPAAVTPQYGGKSISPVDPAITELLDATYFQTIQPTSFVCSSCSLPLVQASKLNEYRDLPSEHWAELVDAWMCHSDQALHEHVQKGSKDGFWPNEGELLVGGSYVLLREDTMVKANFCDIESTNKSSDEWFRVRCLCGAIVGRYQEHKTAEGSTVVYRLPKYAFRPISPIAEPSKVPLSAFIVEDMNEFVHAHATYRFVIADEEEERPRILVWLFKPNMRLAYATPAQYVIPRSGAIRAAKVLFKVLGPTEPSNLPTILNKYPGFPQAEYLYYPRDICRRLAALLKESNTAYPDSMRTMTGLDVGWLQRA